MAPGVGANTLALGWGLTRALRPDDAVSGSVATKLQRVRIPLAQGSSCDAQAAANANAYDNTRQVCGATTGGVDTCYVRACVHAEACLLAPCMRMRGACLRMRVLSVMRLRVHVCARRATRAVRC